MLLGYKGTLKGELYVVALHVSVISCYNSQELLFEVKMYIENCAFSFFVTVWTRPVVNAPKNKEPPFDFSFTTMLQHTSRFKVKDFFRFIIYIGVLNIELFRLNLNM
jgi:hypothetical protein